MNKLVSASLATTVTVLALSGVAAYGAPDTSAGDRGPARSGSECHLSPQEVADWGETSARLPRACGPDAYTVLDHPSLPCHLSRTDVANWGETSAHLPQACSYRREK